jgi:hypothetical protein
MLTGAASQPSVPHKAIFKSYSEKGPASISAARWAEIFPSSGIRTIASFKSALPWRIDLEHKFTAAATFTEARAIPEKM